jgi:hypothetical protein
LLVAVWSRVEVLRNTKDRRDYKIPMCRASTVLHVHKWNSHRVTLLRVKGIRLHVVDVCHMINSASIRSVFSCIYHGHMLTCIYHGHMLTYDRQCSDSSSLALITEICWHVCFPFEVCWSLKVLHVRSASIHIIFSCTLCAEIILHVLVDTWSLSVTAGVEWNTPGIYNQVHVWHVSQFMVSHGVYPYVSGYVYMWLMLATGSMRLTRRSSVVLKNTRNRSCDNRYTTWIERVTSSGVS